MPVLRIESIGEAAPYIERIEQGESYIVELEIENEDGTAYDLTGCTFQGQVRKEAKASSPVLMSFSYVVTLPNKVVLELSSSDTMTALEGVKKVVWNIILIDSLGKKHPLVRNESAEVVPAITR